MKSRTRVRNWVGSYWGKILNLGLGVNTVRKVFSMVIIQRDWMIILWFFSKPSSIAFVRKVQVVVGMESSPVIYARIEVKN